MLDVLEPELGPTGCDSWTHMRRPDVKKMGLKTPEAAWGTYEFRGPPLGLRHITHGDGFCQGVSNIRPTVSAQRVLFNGHCCSRGYCRSSCRHGISDGFYDFVVSVVTTEKDPRR